MKLFNIEKIREWDEYTIRQHFANSSELMERAAQACVDYLEEYEVLMSFSIFCGTGNNGGDGLCIARMLHDQEYPVTVYVVGDAKKGSDDFKKNLHRLLTTQVDVHFLTEDDNRFDIPYEHGVIDCIVGTGLSRTIEGLRASVINRLNALPNKRIAIDVPSGLLPDLFSPQPGVVLKADYTLTFQVPKRAFMFPENFQYVGDFEVLMIGLDTDFAEAHDSDFLYYEETEAAADYKPREKFAHKNDFGHVHLMAGSMGKIGAAILSGRAAMRSGAGLLTVSIPRSGYMILQAALPEAMCIPDKGEDYLVSASYDEKFSSTAIGPGIGQSSETAKVVKNLLQKSKKPLVLDADALNIIASGRLLEHIPPGSILTPHVGEFDRLFGKHANSFERFVTLQQQAARLQVVIVLKGAHTCIASPDGTVVFNSSGNAGLATAGSGDVLTGVISSFLAQGYEPVQAARLGVFVHGMSADLVADAKGVQGMMAGDVIESLPEALKEISESASLRPEEL